MKNNRPPLTQERLKELVDYDPVTGIFRWKERTEPTRENKIFNKRYAGNVAGFKSHQYIDMCIDRKRILAHRAAWLFMTGFLPRDGIDHIDCDGSNNRFSNLREANQSQNRGNSRKGRRNSSGFKGANWHNGKWRAVIRHKHLGTFDTPEEAHYAYMKAARELFGEFARAH